MCLAQAIAGIMNFLLAARFRVAVMEVAVHVPVDLPVIVSLFLNKLRRLSDLSSTSSTRPTEVATEGGH